MKKKLIASVLAAMMVTSMMPSMAFAEGSGEPQIRAAAAENTVDAVKNLIETLDADTAIYSKDYCEQVAEARAAYDELGYQSREVDEDLKKALEAAENKVKVWNEKIAAAEEALNKIPDRLWPADLYDGTGAETPKGSVIIAAEALEKLGEGESDDNEAGLKTGLSQAARDKESIITCTDEIKKALNAIAVLKPSRITRDTYLDDGKITAYKKAKEQISALENKTERKSADLLGNYDLYDKIEKKIKKFNDEIENVRTLATKEKLGGDINSDEPDRISLEAAKTACQKLRAAYEQLSEAQREKVGEESDAGKNDVVTWETITGREKAIGDAEAEAKKQDEITRLEELMNNLPKIVTLKDEADVKEAEALRDKIGKTELEKEKPILLATLVNAREQFEKAYGALSDQEKAKRVKDLVAKLPENPNHVTAEDKPVVEAAKAEYNRGEQNFLEEINSEEEESNSNFSMEEMSSWQKLVIKERDTILACLQVFAKREAEAKDEEKQAKDKASKAYEILASTVDGLSLTEENAAGFNFDNDKTAENLRTAFETAKADYDKLSSDAQEEFKTENADACKKYGFAEKALKNFDDGKAAKEIIELMKLVHQTGFDQPAKEEKLQKVMQAYRAASKDVQQRVRETDDGNVFEWYTGAVDNYNQYKASMQASDVENMIAGLTMLKDDGSATEAEIDAALERIEAAKNALEAIDEDYQVQVKNVADITKTENAANAAAIKLIKGKMDELGNTTADLTETQKAIIIEAEPLVEKYREILEKDAEGKKVLAGYERASEKLKKQTEDDIEWELTALIKTVEAIREAIQDKEITKDNIPTIFAAQKKREELSEEAKEKLKDNETKTVQDANEAIEYLDKAIEEALLISLDRAKITAIQEEVYTGSAITPEVVVKDARDNVIEEKEYKTFYKNNVNVGKATVSVVPTEESKYAGTIAGEFEITAKPISGAGISKVVNCLNNGKARTQNSLRVVVGQNILKRDKDYTVTYVNNRKIGIATLTITGTGNYKGTKTTRFKIVPNKLKSVTVKSPSRKRMKITVRPATVDKAQKVRYQYQYKLKGTKKWKTVYSTKSTLTRNLKSRKTYQVRVRAYKKVGKTLITGAYSTVRSVKVK